MKISFCAALNEETHCQPPSSYILPFSSDNTLIMKNQQVPGPRVIENNKEFGNLYGVEVFII
jgi:hypothetical protein